ncbi:MAG TPA: sigma factor, partial [Dehalococcoidia bacterium]
MAVGSNEGTVAVRRGVEDSLTDEFEQHRPLLFGIAYRMLGSAMEAEDVVQE